ncbi:sulfatase-like hydrolase/transferase [Massilia sp. CMS3.1]|uniref:sulfatase-like hydrolase/transferase n=1 Tax=Massilia sp. CMS3.1 TaxID=3373083 RepID=UPI003EE76388
MHSSVYERARLAQAALVAHPALALRRALPLLLICAALLGAILAGHEGTRRWQVLVLAVPAWAWLWWPMRTRARRLAQGLLCFGLCLGFVLDGALRGFLMSAYDTLPNSAMVLSAVANTTGGESMEFVNMCWRDLLAWAGFALLCVAVLGAGLFAWWRSPPAAPRLRGPAIAVALLIAILVLSAFVSNPWRRHHPFAFWPHWVQDVRDLRQQWADFDRQRAQLLSSAAAIGPTLSGASPDTLVLVISESMNRSNLSNYGYARQTSPQLLERERTLGGQLQVFRHAWSVNASTVPALRNLFYFGSPEAKERTHLLALARAAGYRTFWISNHNDLAIEQEHARLADEVHLLNNTPGRASRALDEQLLPATRAALADPAPRKLIVLHMLGLHPHYRMRHPDGLDPFAHAADRVDARMRSEGRPAWLRELRNDYDSAVRYHDSTVAATLDLARAAAGRQTWVFLSDHGQEVGHTRDRAGHSATTPDGYRIPLMLWSSFGAPAPSQAVGMPVRGDWFGFSLAHLLGIEWRGAQAHRDVLDRRYRWQAPNLPVTIDFGT